MTNGSESLGVATLGPQSDESSHAAARSADTRALWAIGLACLFVYAYFYQGPGYNQHAHFATARAIVEHGTFEITPYKESTGDVSYVGGRIYSSKAPGLALLAAPVYFMLYHVERWAGLDVNVLPVWTFNIYVLTVWTTALPTVGLVLAVYVYLRREGLDVRRGLLLAGSLAFGTLLFPYAGSMWCRTRWPVVCSWRGCSCARRRRAGCWRRGRCSGPRSSAITSWRRWSWCTDSPSWRSTPRSPKSRGWRRG
ncbi:MAG: hypothetical protein WBD40_18575 [Tepidisphaeraceae bacterium]